MLALASCMFFFYYRAGRFNNTYAELKERVENQYEKSERLDSGQWFSNKWEMYHTLSFEPGNKLMVDNHVDTLLRYRYVLDKNILWLIHEKDSIQNKITLRNNHELIFGSFLNSKGELKYSRVKKALK